MASIKDVAKLAGVSISTVSNVINKTKHVSSELKERINKAIDELGYEVNPVGRSLKSRKTMTVGVVIPNIYRIFFPQVIKGIQDTASLHGYSLTLCSTDDKLDKEKHFIQMLASNWIDGIILDSVADIDDKQYLKYIVDRCRKGKNGKEIPILSLERKIDYNGFDSVYVDNYKGGRMAAHVLVKAGCRKMAHITGPIYSSMAKDRLRGYKDELLKNNIDISDELILNGDFSPLSGYQETKKVLMSGTDFDGLFAANDQMAIGALKAIKEYGHRIPEDIKVVGYDNTFIASIVDPSLTTINVQKYRMGAEAMEQLVKRINGQVKEPSHIELSVNLVERQSTDLRGNRDWDLYGW